jgi:hypothetical protein
MVFWSEVDDIMRFWCQISKTRVYDDLIDERIGDDEQIMVDDDESSSVQPASSNISSNVGKGPQQPSIVEDNERMLEEVSDQATTLPTALFSYSLRLLQQPRMILRGRDYPPSKLPHRRERAVETNSDGR